jgi:RNase adaptor protein for sRNA GlmZ degradation
MPVPAAAGRVSVTSFGYGHGNPPAASLTVDLRVQYRVPHADPALRELTAADPRVRAAVLATPGITDLITAITAAVREYLSRGLPVSLAVGCCGGRHRPVDRTTGGHAGLAYAPCLSRQSLHPVPRPAAGPAQKPRLIEIIASLRDRIAETRPAGWQGEVEGLQVSHNAATAKLASLSRNPADGRKRLVNSACRSSPASAPSPRKKEGTTMPAIRLISFGYLHLHGGPPPAADRVEDIRGRLRDPAAAKGILDLDGRDHRVQQIVLNTPGARELLASLADYASLPAGPSVIATGCAGGKHRAAAVTELLGRELRERGFDVEIDHRHVHLPRVLRQAAAGAGGQR